MSFLHLCVLSARKYFRTFPYWNSKSVFLKHDTFYFLLISRHWFSLHVSTVTDYQALYSLFTLEYTFQCSFLKLECCHWLYQILLHIFILSIPKVSFTPGILSFQFYCIPIFIISKRYHQKIILIFQWICLFIPILLTAHF